MALLLRHRFLPFLLLLSMSSACGTGTGVVRAGADVLLEEHGELVRGKSVGLVSNHSGRRSDGVMTADALREAGVRVRAIFTPEHGYRGTGAAGERIGDDVDSATGIPLISLHGEVRAPTSGMLEGIDVLVYDIQDVGVRFYTYISTMKLCMDAAAERGIPFVVLDRPDPQGGRRVDGPVLPDSLRSFLGIGPLPVVYGLTCGELARVINGEGWLKGGRKADLHVVPMQGWRRGMAWEETGLPWPVPSPNLRTPDAAMMYPVTCYLEATNVSEGRGTGEPFLVLGAPFVDGERLARDLSGNPAFPLRAEPVVFTPAASKHQGRRCSGVRLSFRDAPPDAPVRAGLILLETLRAQSPDSTRINGPALDRLLGDPGARRLLEAGETLPAALSARWEAAAREFRRRVAPYLLYQ